MGRVAMRRPLAGLLAAFIAACSGPTGSDGPTGSPIATLTAEASPGPTPVDTAAPSVLASTPPLATPEPTENPEPCSRKGYDGPWNVGPLLPGSAVEVVVAELNLRDGPCTGAKKVATLKKGDILIVDDGGYGPFKGNGYPWYGVTRPNVTGADGGLPPLPLPPVTYEKDLVGGWIAATDGSRPYVVPIAPRCPATIDLANVRGMLPAERLACFETSFVLQGTFGCGGCGGTGGPFAAPPWLATGFEAMNLRTRWDLDERPISIYFKPSGPDEPREGRIIRVTLHVDDPASRRCELHWGLEEPPFDTPPEIAIPYCRERMVVESYEVLGKDPSY